MNEELKPTPDRPLAAFVVSLIAGLWMLAMGSMMGWGYMGGYGRTGHMTYDGGLGYGWMWQHHRLMHGYGGGVLWSWIGIAAAVIVIVGAFALYFRPATAKNWGIVIVVVCAVDLLAGAGGLFAGVLGIIGGILAVAWEPPG
jgi:hypothetical protein